MLQEQAGGGPSEVGEALWHTGALTRALGSGKCLGPFSPSGPGLHIKGGVPCRETEAPLDKPSWLSLAAPCTWTLQAPAPQNCSVPENGGEQRHSPNTLRSSRPLQARVLQLSACAWDRSAILAAARAVHPTGGPDSFPALGQPSWVGEGPGPLAGWHCPGLLGP